MPRATSILQVLHLSGELDVLFLLLRLGPERSSTGRAVRPNDFVDLFVDPLKEAQSVEKVIALGRYYDFGVGDGVLIHWNLLSSSWLVFGISWLFELFHAYAASRWL